MLTRIGASSSARLAMRVDNAQEERLQGARIVGVEGRGALRAKLERRLLEAFGIAPSEDNAGALGAGSPGGFQPDAGAAADDDDGLAEQFRFALGDSSGGGGHDSSGASCGRLVTKCDSYHPSTEEPAPPWRAACPSVIGRGSPHPEVGCSK
jgi:hypothetical protein